MNNKQISDNISMNTKKLRIEKRLRFLLGVLLYQLKQNLYLDRPKKAMFEASKKTKNVDAIEDTKNYFKLDYNNTPKIK